MIIIGAGPAGTLAALSIARQGCRVLLIDKARFPRDKVCGGCLNPAASQLLASVGLGDLPRTLGGRPTYELLLGADGRQAAIALEEGVAISRGALDAGLVRAAIDAGAEFLDLVNARVLESDADGISVRITDPTLRERVVQGGTPPQRMNPGECPVSPVRPGNHTLRARVVLAADGLAGTSLRDCPWLTTHVRKGSRIGAGASLVASDEPPWRPGVIHMACGRGGYVGLVRTEGDGLNVAAAFDIGLVRSCGGLAEGARTVLHQAGMPEPVGLLDAAWHGTAMLTVSRRPVAGERVLLVGDAAEYVEPFTGEGMAWAIASGIAAASPAVRAARAWRAELVQEWIRRHRTIIHAPSLRCRAIAWGLRQPLLTRTAVRVFARIPRAARPIVHAFAAPLMQPR